MTVKEKLIVAYKNNIANEVKADLQEEENEEADHRNEANTEIEKWPTTWWQQYTVLLKRGLRERKHESFNILKIAQVLIVAFIVGLLWWQSKITHLQDQVIIEC